MIVKKDLRFLFGAIIVLLCSCSPWHYRTYQRTTIEAVKPNQDTLEKKLSNVLPVTYIHPIQTGRKTLTYQQQPTAIQTAAQHKTFTIKRPVKKDVLRIKKTEHELHVFKANQVLKLNLFTWVTIMILFFVAGLLIFFFGAILIPLSQMVLRIVTFALAGFAIVTTFVLLVLGIIGHM